MLIAAAISLSLACCSQQQADSTLEGVSVPLRQDLGSELNDALVYLSQQRWTEAIPILQRLADSPPSAVHKQQNNLYVGIASFAAMQLRKLSGEAQQWYHNNYQEQAAAIVTAHQSPLNITALETAAQRFAGLDAAATARQVLHDAYVDRNYYELYQEAQQSRRPYLAHEGIAFKWDYSFDDILPLRHSTHRLAFGNGLVYATNGHDVVALDSATGSQRWKFENQAWHNMDNKLNNELHAAQSKFTALQPVLSDGVLLVNIHLAQAVGRSDKYRNIDIRHMTPLRRLHAFDALSGELLWQQTIDSDAAKTSSIAIGAPLVSAGRVFIPVYDAGGNVDISLMCFDLQSGKKLFKTFLASGSMETNLFGNLLTEVATPAPVSDGEHVWLLSQFGTLSCVAARTGIIEWTRTYPRTKVIIHQDGRLSQRVSHFANNNMFLNAGTLVVAPLDSQTLFAVNGKTGELLKSYPAQDRDDNRMRYILDFDGEGLITSGSHLQKINFTTGREAYTSPQLYRYNGYNNENLLSSQLSTTQAWMPYENGVAVADLDDIQATHSVVDWNASAELASSPIQLADGALLFLTRSGISCFTSDQSFAISVAQAETTRADLYFYMGVGSDNMSAVKSIRQKLQRQLVENYFGVIDKDFASLVIARCYLLLGAKEPALSRLIKLSASVDEDVAWQAAVLYAEGSATSTSQLSRHPLRPALLLSRNIVSASALDAKLAGNWQRLLESYLADSDNQLVYDWLSATLNDATKQQQLEAWLDEQLAHAELSLKKQISLFNVAYRFSSDRYSNHTRLLESKIELARVIDIKSPAEAPLPFQWTLLHAFAGKEDLLLFQSQHTLILVRNGEPQYITPFDADARISSLVDKCVVLENGCAVISANVCVYFNDDGSYQVNNIDANLSTYSSPQVVGKLVLHISHSLNEGGSGLVLVEPRSGRIVCKQNLENELNYRNDILVAGKHAIYITKDWLADIDLSHQRDAVSVSKQRASEILANSAPDEILFGNLAASNGELSLSFTDLDGNKTTTAIPGVPFANCIQRSFTNQLLANGSLSAFIVEDITNRKLVLHLVLINTDDVLIGHQSLDLIMLSTAQPQIFVTAQHVIVSVSNRHYTFKIK